MKKKSLIAKKKIHKNFIEKLKDKKILKSFNKINNNLKKIKLGNKVALALSGGPDSLSLLFLIKLYFIVNNLNTKIYIFHVKHGLRPDTNSEIEIIRKIIKKYNFYLNILKWKGFKPKKNIQSVARKFRYELLIRESEKRKVNYLLTAHHKGDLYENFFIRILRGSGLKGISSFNSIISKSNSMQLLRPLLNFEKSELIYISKKVFGEYLIDSWNENDSFQRSRIRKLITFLKKEGLDFEKLKLTIDNLSISNDTINFYVDQNVSENVFF